MNRIWQLLMGIDQSSPGVVTGGDSRLEFASLPRGTAAAILIVGAILLGAIFWRLHRWDAASCPPGSAPCWSVCAC